MAHNADYRIVVDYLNLQIYAISNPDDSLMMSDRNISLKKPTPK